MREVTVAVVQMHPRLAEVEENLTNMSDFMEKICTEQNVDLIVFPELRQNVKNFPVQASWGTECCYPLVLTNRYCML